MKFNHADGIIYAFQLVQVNLSHMLCPAILDPFDGENYRIWATCHQLILIPLLYKLFCVGADFFLTKFPLTRVKSTLDEMLVNDSVKDKSSSGSEVSNTSGNLHKHSE